MQKQQQKRSQINSTFHMKATKKRIIKNDSFSRGIIYAVTKWSECRYSFCFRLFQVSLFGFCDRVFFQFRCCFLRCLVDIISSLLNKYTLFFVVVSFFIPGPCLSPSSGFLFVCFCDQEAPCSKKNQKVSA